MLYSYSLLYFGYVEWRDEPSLGYGATAISCEGTVPLSFPAGLSGTRDTHGYMRWKWKWKWRLGGSPGFLFGDIMLLREGLAAKTVKSLMLMTVSSELLTFRVLGGLTIMSKSLLRALGTPLDVKMELLGATRLPKRGFWRLWGRLGTPKWSSQELRSTSARR